VPDQNDFLKIAGFNQVDYRIDMGPERDSRVRL
jgi:hypothetical protein